jgi:hypothetical protein
VNLSRWSWLFLLVPLLAAAPEARPPHGTSGPEALLRAGDAAFRANDLDKAAEMYDRAGVRTIEPSRAAFNLATATYRLARGGKVEALADAEVGYGSCLEKGDPYRARALFGLGNCLLLRASSGATLDRAALRAAIDRFSACLADPGCEAALAADARHNRARARLLLLQAPPPPGTSDEGDSDDQKKPDDKDDQPPSDEENGTEPGPGSPQRSPGTAPGSGAEQTGDRQEGTTGPGQGGKPPPVSDDPGAAPLSERDAAEHIARAAREILKEARAYRRGKARQAAPGVRDW